MVTLDKVSLVVAAGVRKDFTWKRNNVTIFFLVKYQ